MKWALVLSVCVSLSHTHTLTITLALYFFNIMNRPAFLSSAIMIKLLEFIAKASTVSGSILSESKLVKKNSDMRCYRLSIFCRNYEIQPRVEIQSLES